MRFVQCLRVLCCLLPAAPACAAFAWVRLPTAAAGELVFADATGFALHAGGELRLFTLQGDLRRTVKYEAMGEGRLTLFADASAIEIGGTPQLRVYDENGNLARSGTVAELTGQPRWPSYAAKAGKVIWLEIDGGLVQLDTENWMAILRAGWQRPKSAWGEENFKITRRLTTQPAPTAEETVLERILPDGTKTAEFSLPVWREAGRCFFEAYPLEGNEVVFSSSNEAVVLDRRTLVPRQRFPWNSCGPDGGNVTRFLDAWWQGAALSIRALAYRSSGRTVLRFGDHERSVSYPWSGPDHLHPSLRSPLRWDRWKWNGAGRIYAQYGTGGDASYGFFDLTRPSVRGGGVRRTNLCQAGSITFSLPAFGGQAPYSCFKSDGTPLPDCQYTYAFEGSCLFGQTSTVVMPEYHVVDARGDREVATTLILPLPGQEQEALLQPVAVHEFHNDPLNHYFMTINEMEREFIALGDAGPGWTDLGARFLGWLPGRQNAAVSALSGASNEVAVCRFYGKPGLGPNSHFYALAGRECEAVKQDPGWIWEAENTFFVLQPGIDGACPPWTDTVWRAYNNRHMQNDANHRYAIDRQMLDAMTTSGWTVEGVAFCAPRILN